MEITITITIVGLIAVVMFFLWRNAEFNIHQKEREYKKKIDDIERIHDRHLSSIKQELYTAHAETDEAYRDCEDKLYKLRRNTEEERARTAKRLYKVVRDNRIPKEHELFSLTEKMLLVHVGSTMIQYAKELEYVEQRALIEEARSQLNEQERIEDLNEKLASGEITHEEFVNETNNEEVQEENNSTDDSDNDTSRNDYDSESSDYGSSDSGSSDSGFSDSGSSD